MFRSCLACVTAVLVLVGSVAADQKNKQDKGTAKPTTATITKVDAKKGEITVKYTDETGKSQEKTFQLASDVRLLDETGRVVQLDVFESGNDALVVESEGKLLEVRRAPHRNPTRRLSDAVSALIEMTDCEKGCAEDLQKIYDMLRRLDTGKNGKIDPKALKAEAEQILHDRVQQVFQRLDTNKDGKISREEARGLIKEHFDKIDSNKDGLISFDELLTASRERREQRAADVKAADHQPTGKERR
jgi:Ca2+-binding EF-hand superfamily protein